MNDGISDGHVSLYPWEWLVKNISTKRWYEEQQKISDLKYISRTPALINADHERTFWGRDISSSPPSVHYEEIMADDEGVGKWTAKIVGHFFVIHRKAC
jgi:trimethyllysine dioxygenase